MHQIKAFGGKTVTRAPKGGFEHPVNGKFYKGGRFCPLFAVAGGSDEAKAPAVDYSKGLEYVAVVSDLRTRTTTREYFQAPHYLDAKSRYAKVGNVNSHVGPVTVRIFGLGPIGLVYTGRKVTILNPDNSIAEVGHVVTTEDHDSPAFSKLRCFEE